MGKIINSAVTRAVSGFREAANYALKAMESTKLKAYCIQKAGQLKHRLKIETEVESELRRIAEDTTNFHVRHQLAEFVAIELKTSLSTRVDESNPLF